MALSKTTRDHDEIRKWAEARGAKPAEVAGTERGNQTGILRFEFPKAPHHNDSKLKEIEWDEFFEKFDASDLELLYQDVTAEGAQSNFNKLIHPTDDEHSSKSTKTSHAKSDASSHSTSGGHETKHASSSHTAKSHASK